MSAVRNAGRTATVLAVVCASVFVTQAAFAGRGKYGNNGDTEQSANADDKGNLSVTVGGIVFDRSKNGSGGSAGALTSSTSWSPPACWYAPKYTPEQLQKYLEPIWEAGSTGYEWDAEQREKYNADDEKKAFNKHKSGEGFWWGSYVNKSYPPGWDACTEDYFWVDTGDAPPADIENAITPEILAGLAYAEIRVPGTEVTLAPTETTKVNLPTWAWLDGAEFKPVSVTASVPDIGISATATAEPVSLEIKPGTPDAQTYPASGVCGIDGRRIGEPYQKGDADRTPPCGVKYLRSSGDGAFPLQATVTWEIHWTGTGGAGGDLPDGEFGATQDVVVQEIQAINR
ncbi:secreted protein [Streptomyces griseoflavus Tu4000]|uniref:Secreted protein n=1 Tax=Streptomyces griseoflavus Tu4000 TaxID=467200 RepID=D9XRN8_9ACTN|nr:secreted protein [Streptomyces griseoflavus Tu4000]